MDSAHNTSNWFSRQNSLIRFQTLEMTQDRSLNSQAHLFAAYNKRATCGEPRIQECKISDSLRLFQSAGKV